MPSPLLDRHPLKQLFKRCTVKLLSSPGGAFLGTGFFITPEKLATCHHVLYPRGKALARFSIEGQPGEYTLKGAQQQPGLDLLILHLGTPLSEHCINLASTPSKEGDRLWGWSYNTNYPAGAGLLPVLQEEAQHQGWAILRVSRDIVKQGSSGTPILNVDSGKLLGVTYWVKDEDALIIPAQYFQQHFPDLYTENQNHHQQTTYWAEAQRQSRPQRTKRLTLIPPIDNRDVIGRAEDLATLRQRLQDSHKVLLMNGIGGIGKTTLAKLYLNNYAEEYEHLLWLEQTDDLLQTIATNSALLRSLGLEQLTGLSPQELFQQVMLSLQNFNEGLNLLVIDNATQALRPLKDSLPHGPHWHVLLTSREQVSTSFELLELGTLEPAAALELFRRHCHKPQDEAPLLAFLTQLQFHTLSIELFAKILDSHWQLDSVAELSDYLRHNQIDEEILQTVIELEHAKGETQLYRHLLSAFDLSGLSTRPELILILQRMAALPPSADGYVVKDLIEWFGMEEEATDFVNHLQELFKLGWLSQTKQHYFGLHRLIALILSKVYSAGLEELQPLVETFIEKLSLDGIKDNPVGKFPWVPFAQVLLEVLAAQEWEQKSTLQNNLALVLQALGDYAGARSLLEKAVLSDERNYGLDHPNTAGRYSNLALVLKDLGDYAGARVLLEKAVASAERDYGLDHPNTARRYSNLALVLKDLGDYAGARVLLEKAIASAERNYGLDHLSTAMWYSNLAVVLEALGDYAGAKALLEKAVMSAERDYGLDHPITAVWYSNLAIVLQDLGDYTGARVLLEKAVASDELNYGLDHPSTARSYSNLAVVLRALEDYAGARTLLGKAVSSAERNYGLEHPNTAVCYSNLGSVFFLLGQYVEARSLLAKAYAIYNTLLGPDHPSTQTIARNLQYLNDHEPPSS